MGQEVSHQVPQLKREDEQQHNVDDDKPEEDEREHLKGRYIGKWQYFRNGKRFRG